MTWLQRRWRRWRLRRRIHRVRSPYVAPWHKDQMVDEMLEVIDLVEHMN